MTHQADPDPADGTGTGAGPSYGDGSRAGADYGARADRTGSDRYVRFLEPSQRGSSPYTVEGYLGGISNFASGAVRVHGWRRNAAKILVVVLLLPIALMILHWAWTLLSLLSSF